AAIKAAYKSIFGKELDNDTALKAATRSKNTIGKHLNEAPVEDIARLVDTTALRTEETESILPGATTIDIHTGMVSVKGADQMNVSAAAVGNDTASLNITEPESEDSNENASAKNKGDRIEDEKKREAVQNLLSEAAMAATNPDEAHKKQMLTNAIRDFKASFVRDTSRAARIVDIANRIAGGELPAKTAVRLLTRLDFVENPGNYENDWDRIQDFERMLSEFRTAANKYGHPLLPEEDLASVGDAVLDKQLADRAEEYFNTGPTAEEVKGRLTDEVLRRLEEGDEIPAKYIDGLTYFAEDVLGEKALAREFATKLYTYNARPTTKNQKPALEAVNKLRERADVFVEQADESQAESLFASTLTLLPRLKKAVEDQQELVDTLRTIPTLVDNEDVHLDRMLSELPKEAQEYAEAQFKSALGEHWRDVVRSRPLFTVAPAKLAKGTTPAAVRLA
ncbi:hypothetical protein D6779_02285, partial [Candidatus Parcubacteria bacterium]